MGEIKFRAWDGKKYHRLGSFQFDQDDYNNHVTFFEFEGIESGEICVGNSSREYLIEQYTKSKDCEGVEIYEGDIVKRDDGEKAIIVFYANSWCFDMSKFYPSCREGWIEEIKGNPKLTIIGNIHENPELLEK